MKRERDEMGRFAPGHSISKGNRGNHRPKWGSKNRRKYGKQAKPTELLICPDTHQLAVFRWTGKEIMRFFDPDESRFRIACDGVIWLSAEMIGLELARYQEQ
ncbi:hypothetical protein [Brevibacillus dissolubilis]|uniref:hypothetical protein n=1 Tax=Brevibacillus dissolubilis TaxID=1844116 RepID=UPI001115C5D2|nr:hypothetical protein [Brevibacillus dissolubilis]